MRQVERLVREERTDRNDILATKFAREEVWKKFDRDGETKLAGFVTEMRKLGGTVYMHGKMARNINKRDCSESTDIDLVVTGVDGEKIEDAAKEKLIECDVKARCQRETGVIKTVEVARNGELMADLVCARNSDGEPDVSAGIVDHLNNCWTVDGIVVAYELTEENEQISLRRLIINKGVELDYRKVSPDHIWWWFRALVRGEVQEEWSDNGACEVKVVEMLEMFIKNRSSDLVNWRKDGQSMDNWVAECQERGRKIIDENSLRLRVPALAARTFEWYHAEGIAEKLSDALWIDPGKFWGFGMRTRLLSLVFPVLGLIPDKLKREIEQEIDYVYGESIELKWMAIFGPIFKHVYKLAYNSRIYETEINYFKRYSWERAMLLIVNDLGYLTNRDEARRKLNGGNEVENVKDQLEGAGWIGKSLWPFMLMNEGRLAAVLRKQVRSNAAKKIDRVMSNYDLPIDRRMVIRESVDASVGKYCLDNSFRFCRHIAWLIYTKPEKLLEMLFSYLPMGAVLSKEKLISKMNTLVLSIKSNPSASDGD